MSHTEQMRDALQLASDAIEAVLNEMTVGDRFTNAGQGLIDVVGPIRAALTAPAAEPEPLPSALKEKLRSAEAYIATLEAEATRLRGGVPDGWKLERKESDDRIVLTSPTGDAWSWADRVPGGGTSGEFVYLFLSALLDAAQPISMRGGVPEGWQFRVLSPGSITVQTESGYTCTLWKSGHGGVEALAYQMADMLRNLTAAPQAPALDAGVVRDAERYRIVRRGQHWSTINGIGDVLRGEALDADADAKLAAMSAHGGA